MERPVSCPHPRRLGGNDVPGPIVHVVGARPNFMKAAPVVSAMRELGVDQRLVHTGQHYDAAMSGVFFAQLDLPQPDLNLGVGSGTQAQQTAALLSALEAAFEKLSPSALVVYGDINSTLAASLVAVKLGIFTAHVEAGLRSFDMSMPEEVNRRVVDALADMLLVTSPEAVGHLAREGRDARQIYLVGNPMIDTLLKALPALDTDSMLKSVGVAAGSYAVATLHRPANVDSPDAARRLVDMLRAVTDQLPVVLPLHPRGRPTLEAVGLEPSERLRVIEPLGYLEFLSLVRGARLVLTDSGGLQEEATILEVPCLTLRPNTERPITISHGTNRLTTPADAPALVQEILSGAAQTPLERPPLWDGKAGERIARLLAARVACEARSGEASSAPH
jgi:UDP-N-acetylglucosamine 2-epimerase (non-hydrolysing)